MCFWNILCQSPLICRFKERVGEPQPELKWQLWRLTSAGFALTRPGQLSAPEITAPRPPPPPPPSAILLRERHLPNYADTSLPCAPLRPAGSMLLLHPDVRAISHFYPQPRNCNLQGTRPGRAAGSFVKAPTSPRAASSARGSRRLACLPCLTPEATGHVTEPPR